MGSEKKNTVNTVSSSRNGVHEANCLNGNGQVNNRNGSRETDGVCQKPKTVLPDTALASTFGAFSYLIQEKKKRQLEADSIIESETKQRHALVLEAMTGIRRSLTDITRIELGERFCLEIDVDDWKGWPRITVSLVDIINPHADKPFIQVTANDYRARGNVEIVCNDPTHPYRISVIDNNEIRRLPIILRRATRSFLDIVGEIVVSAQGHEAIINDDLLAKQLEETVKGGDISSMPSSNTQEIKADVFDDDCFREDFLEQLPKLDTLDLLPDVQTHQNKSEPD